MRSRWNLPIFISYALISALVAGYLLVQMGGEFNFVQQGYRIQADFVSASELVAGDDVTISGLRVGRVERIEPTGSGALVHLQLHTQYSPFYRDARAVVKGKNLLGEKYVELSRGTPASGAMDAGATIPQTQTLTPVEVDEVLNALDPSVRGRLTILINTLGAGVAGQGANLNVSAHDLSVLAQALEGIAHSLASSQQDLSSLLISLNKVMQTLATWHSEFRGLITNWDRLMRVLASHEATFTGTLVEQDRVLALLDQAFAGGADQSLNSALAEAPQTLTNVDDYLNLGSDVFTKVNAQHTDIARLFFELASVMSFKDSSGRHHWRVYNTFTCDQPIAVIVPGNPLPTGSPAPTIPACPAVPGGVLPSPLP